MADNTSMNEILSKLESLGFVPSTGKPTTRPDETWLDLHSAFIRLNFRATIDADHQLNFYAFDGYCVQWSLTGIDCDSVPAAVIGAMLDNAVNTM